MFEYIINVYCDYVIMYHKKIKNMINPLSMKESILNLSRSDAFEFITTNMNDYNKSKITLYPTRKERYLLYKKLKGKDSPLLLYSHGNEKYNTQKMMIIKIK